MRLIISSSRKPGPANTVSHKNYQKYQDYVVNSNNTIEIPAMSFFDGLVIGLLGIVLVVIVLLAVGFVIYLIPRLIKEIFWAMVPAKHGKYYNYICPKCDYRHQLDRKVKIYECPRCHTKYKNLFRIRRRQKILSETKSWVFALLTLSHLEWFV